MRSRWITGGGGIRLHLASTGPEDAPPILFIHGYAQSHLSWRRQFDSDLAERFHLHALDSRGQGMSETPEGHAPYNDSRLWADDLAATVAACGTPPVIAGWSYGGLAIGDYIRHHGDAALAGIVLIGAVMGQGQGSPAPTETSPSPMYSSDIGICIPALRTMCEMATETGLADEDLADTTAIMARVPAHVRLGINMRTESYIDDYAKVSKPVWILFGAKDRMVSPREGEEARAAMPHADHHVWPGIGHMPFWEDAPRFNAELARFADRCFAGLPT